MRQGRVGLDWLGDQPSSDLRSFLLLALGVLSSENYSVLGHSVKDRSNSAKGKDGCSPADAFMAINLVMEGR